MKQGDTAYYNGVQVSLFPLDILWCTQIPAPGEFSHCCGTPTDWIGTYAVYPYYAPFDCHRLYINRSTGWVVYGSDNPVYTPTGTRYISVEFQHDDNIPTRTNFRQGELIGHTGTTGFVTGDHVHLDQCAGIGWVDIPSGIICPGTGTECYEVQDGLMPPQAYFITGEEQIVNTMGLQFQTYSNIGHKPPLWLLGGLTKKRKDLMGDVKHRKLF